MQSQAAPSYAAEDTYIVKADTIRDTLAISGSIDAESQAQVKFLAGGRVTWVGVKEGDVVEDGQPLASLDHRELQKTFQKSLNQYKISRNTFDQTEDDNEDWGAYEPEVADKMRRIINNAQQDLENSVINVELQQLAIEYATIYSPIAGLIVSAPTIYEGSNVSPGEIGYTIINPATMYFSASVDQGDVVRLAEGLTGDIVFDSFPDEETTGTIRSISYTPKPNEVGTVYEVEVIINDTALLSRLRLGMTGDITFVLTEKEDVLSIPTEYLQIDADGNDFVYVVEDDVVTEVPITVGLDAGGSVEVLDGIEKGYVLVSSIE